MTERPTEPEPDPELLDSLRASLNLRNAERPPEPWMVALVDDYARYHMTFRTDAKAYMLALIQKHYQPPQPQPSAREERLAAFARAVQPSLSEQAKMAHHEGLPTRESYFLALIVAARKALEEKA